MYTTDICCSDLAKKININIRHLELNSENAERFIIL